MRMVEVKEKCARLCGGSCSRTSRSDHCVVSQKRRKHIRRNQYIDDIADVDDEDEPEDEDEDGIGGPEDVCLLSCSHV